MGEQYNSKARGSVRSLDGRVTITVEEAADILGIGRSAAYEAVRRGDLPSRRLGRRIVIPVPALLTWLGVPEESPATES